MFLKKTLILIFILNKHEVKLEQIHDSPFRFVVLTPVFSSNPFFATLFFCINVYITLCYVHKMK